MRRPDPTGRPFAGPAVPAWKSACLALALSALAGCKAEIYTRMTESDANDTLYTLLQGGVDADKRVDPEGGFTVLVDKDELARAIGLLKANAQPEQKHPSLGDLFGRNQLISTPAEERIRFVYGTEQAVAQTLSKIDGVLVARVHIVLPVNDPLASETRPSSASVFIKHRPGQDMASSVPAIKELVVRSIEGLSLDRVAVTLFAAAGGYAAAPDEGTAGAARGGGRFMGVQVPAGSVGALWARFALAAAGVGVSLAFALRHLLRGERPRARRASAKPSHRSSQVPHG